MVAAEGAFIASLLTGAGLGGSCNQGKLSFVLAAAFDDITVLDNRFTIGADQVAGVAVIYTDGLHSALDPGLAAVGTFPLGNDGSKGQDAAAQSSREQGDCEGPFQFIPQLGKCEVLGHITFRDTAGGAAVTAVHYLPAGNFRVGSF